MHTEFCHKRLEEKNDQFCAKPAEFIVWGKLFPPEALGPRCYGCAVADGVTHYALNPDAPEKGYAVYHLPKLKDERIEEARGELATVLGMLRLSGLDEDYEIYLERVMDRLDRATQGENYIKEWQELKDEVGDALGFDPPRVEALP